MNWLNKLKISNALDSGQPLPPGLRDKIARSPDLCRFEKNAVTLNRELRAALPQTETPASLHAAITRSVRRVGPGAASLSPRFKTLLRRLPASAVAAIVLTAWLFLRSALPPVAQTPESQVLAHAATTLDLGQQIAHAAPDAVLTPLSDEWQRLNHDLDQTAQFLLASLP
jgi:hypothetical protein